jgi:peptidoglycan/xylan/chitin deacetylase (PgdA/CDA1 family)
MNCVARVGTALTAGLIAITAAAECAVKRGALCITVDDRRFDNWEESLPLFAKYGAHATFFACGPIDARAEACLRRISKAGHSIGLHGLKHLKVPEMVAKLGEEGYIAAEILPQLSVCREKGLPVKSFAYPMSAHTPETDALLLKHFNRLRGGGGEFKAPFPFAEAGGRRFVAGLGSVGVNHTGEKIAGMLREVAERNLVLVVYTHGILDKPTTHCASHADLEQILSAARGLGVAVIGFDELPVD